MASSAFWNYVLVLAGEYLIVCVHTSDHTIDRIVTEGVCLRHSGATISNGFHLPC